jgi:hypothetical protein
MSVIIILCVILCVLNARVGLSVIHKELASLIGENKGLM